MFKLLGLMGLLCTSGFIGIYKSMELKERITILDDFKKMTLTLRSRINYYREPLPVLFENLIKTGDSKAFQLLNECLLEFNRKDAEIRQIWADKVISIYGKSVLKNEDLETFTFAGNFIGQTDYDNQLNQFEFLDKRIDELLIDAKSDYQKKGPLYRKIGFFIGTILVVILL